MNTHTHTWTGVSIRAQYILLAAAAAVVTAAVTGSSAGASLC